MKRVRVTGHGWSLYLNLAAGILVVMFATALADKLAAESVMLGIPVRHLITAVVIVAVALLLGILAFRKDARFNRRVFGLILFSGFSLEASMMLLNPSSSHGDDIYRAPTPYVMFTGKPGATARVPDYMERQSDRLMEIRINELGLRIEGPLPRVKPQGEVRIFMLGGSTVFHGSRLGDSIPGRLQQRFLDDGDDHVRVLNAGVISYVSSQELSLLVHTIVDYGPDLIIVYDGGNDVVTPWFYDPRPGYPYNFYGMETALRDFKQRSPLVALRTLAAQSHVLSFILGGDQPSPIVSNNALRDRVSYREEAWERAVVDVYVRNVEKMAAVARAFDIGIVFILQPLVHFKSPLTAHESALRGEVSFQEYVDRQYERMRARLAGLDEAQGLDGGCAFVDMSRVFDGYERETFWDYIHTDNEGNRHLADRIYEIPPIRQASTAVERRSRKGP